MSSRAIDHGTMDQGSPLDIDDTHADPEGAKNRTQPPILATNNEFVKERVFWNEKTRRFEPTQWFIKQMADELRELFNSFQSHRASVAISPQHRKLVTGVLNHASKCIEDSGAINGYIFSLVNLYLERAANAYVWASSGEDLIARMNDREVEETTIEPYEDKVESNWRTFDYFMALLSCLVNDHEASVNPIGFTIAARTAVWGYCGFFIRAETAPNDAAHKRASRRTGIEAYWARHTPTPEEAAIADEEKSA